MAFEYVTRYTRAPHEGKEVFCPHCHRSLRVYHFAFWGIRCLHCSKDIQKLDLLIKKKDKNK